MNILYVSVHQILEYDEIRMFQKAGHVVFSLGVYFGFKASQQFRPELPFGDAERRMMAVFEASGCSYEYGSPIPDQILTDSFIDQFDIVLVMHSIDFIEHHWNTISRCPVIWRTIGVNIEAEEERIAPFRAKGCKIVRYSPMEALAKYYAGHDAVIRFGKFPNDFAPWTGEAKQVVLFSMAMKARFPAEYEQVAESLQGFPHVIGGAHNQDIPNAVGVVPYEGQLDLLRKSRIYLYGAGTFISYTLNFIEAWMSGIPVIVLDGRSVLPADYFRFAEVTSLINGGTSGMIVTSVSQAKDVIAYLLDNIELAGAIGTNGRAAATAIFGVENISKQWNEFLATLV